MKNLLLVAILITTFVSCKVTTEVKTTGSIERLDPSLDAIISEGAKIEVLAEGYKWSEGPVWVESQKMLLFSDVPANTIYKWTEKGGAEVYLTPSGYTGDVPSISKEPGSNGLTLDPDGRLVMCQHGDRRVSRMNAPFEDPNPVFIPLVETYEGKKFNSPNDVIFRKNGDMFFTDPPYGLLNQDEDTTKQIPFNGVYKVSTTGEVTLLVDSITRPNGLALTPDEKTLIVASSDPAKAIWYAFDLAENDSIVNPRILFNATENTKTEKGLPDGLRVDRQGNIFASGPGGIWIFNKEAKVIGKIKLSNATANCELADNDTMLYITSHNQLLRIKLR